MQHDIGEMMAAGPIHAEKLAVEHVREPGERVPIGGADLREGPDDSPGGDAGRDEGILAHVFVVVDVHEVVPQRLAEDQRNGQHEKPAYRQKGEAIVDSSREARFLVALAVLPQPAFLQTSSHCGKIDASARRARECRDGGGRPEQLYWVAVDPCQLVWQVNESFWQEETILSNHDPDRLVRSVKESSGRTRSARCKTRSPARRAGRGPAEMGFHSR